MSPVRALSRAARAVVGRFAPDLKKKRLHRRIKRAAGKDKSMQELLTTREIALISIILHTYITSESCKESERIKDELKEIIRKLDNALAD